MRCCALAVLGALGLGAIAAVAPGCGTREDDVRGAASPTPSVPVTRPVPDAPPPAIELPPRGEARAVRSGDRYTFVSNGAPPGEALDALAAEARFAVEGEPPDAETAPAPIDLRDVSALDAVRAILADADFVAHFEPGAGGRVTLSRVSLGTPDAAPPEAPAERAAPGDAEPGEVEPAFPREAPAEAERRAAIERDWQDARDSVRLEALDAMDPDLDRDKLETLLRADPSAEVRAEAADALADADAFAATEPLLAALDDRDPAVVLAAVRSLEDVYDAVPNPRIRERLATLRDHQDAGVRAAVADFDDWIAP